MILARPQHLCLAVAGGAVDQPGADRVHPPGLREVERRSVAAQPVEPCGEGAEPWKRQVALESEHPSAVLSLFSEPGDTAHSCDML